MPGIPPEIAVCPVQHLPIIKAYADQLGLVSLIHHYVPTEMDVDAGTIVLGLVLDTLSGRRPLYRLEEFFAHQDTELLLGKALPPQAQPFQHESLSCYIVITFERSLVSRWRCRQCCWRRSLPPLSRSARFV
jgi:hypothetical protein